MKLYSLTMNGKEEVSVEMDSDITVPGITPRLDRQWLRGIVTERIRKKTSTPTKSRRRHTAVPA